jgi:16S rRNA (guanine(966)-N(2))-methyltransferase RsmD
MWIRNLDGEAPRLIEGSDDVSDPFWSPDSKQIACFTSSKLKRVAADGGAVSVICDAAAGGGGTWGANDTIVFAPQPQGPLARVNASNGQVQPATKLDAGKGETHHLYPAFLPGGEAYVFYINSKERGLYVADVDDGDDRERLFDPDPSLPAAAVTPGLYATGHLFYVRDRVLMAVPFDVADRDVTGDPIKVASTVDYEPPGQAAFTVAGNTLVYRARPDPPIATLSWVDRSGKDVARVDMPAGSFRAISLSPDGRLAAMDRSDAQGLSSVWIADLVAGTSERVPAAYWSGEPVWSRDGNQLAFSVAQDSPPNIAVRADRGRGPERRVSRADAVQYVNDWLPDGQRLLYQESSPDTGWDLYMLSITDGATPQRVLKTKANERGARISPDGRWLSYLSDDSGPFEAYVARFPEMEPRAGVDLRRRARVLAARWTRVVLRRAGWNDSRRELRPGRRHGWPCHAAAANRLVLQPVRARRRRAAISDRPPRRSRPHRPARTSIESAEIMRIIAGTNKGRTLKAPSWNGLRPTSDKLRETLFNIVAPDVAGARVLDVFAGTGAVALEALSRGAATAVCIENDRRAVKLIGENRERCGAADRCAIIRGNAGHVLAAPIEGGPFDLIVLDPPYDYGHLEDAVRAAAGQRAAGARLVLEHASRVPPPAPPGLTIARTVMSGDSALTFYA